MVYGAWDWSNDPDYAWYKDLDAFDDPIAYENDGVVYNYKNGKPIYIIVFK